MAVEDGALSIEVSSVGNYSSDDEEKVQQIRVYDARYKIPRNTNLVDIEKKF